MRRDAVTFDGHKICWRCKEDKPNGSFSSIRNGRGLHYLCKKCSNERAKEWYSKNTERAKASRIEWARFLRNKAIAGLGGYSCSCCGETLKSMLDIDHINNDGHRHRKATGSSTAVYHDIISNPHRYQVLCCNCNQSKRRTGRFECEHKMVMDWDKNTAI